MFMEILQLVEEYLRSFPEGKTLYESLNIVDENPQDTAKWLYYDAGFAMYCYAL
jgi:hypothetical protein